MKFNKWTLALASAGVIGLGSAVQAEEGQHPVQTALSATTLSGYVDTSAVYKIGDNGVIPGHTFTGTRDKQDGFNLHAVKLVLEKPLDEGQWSAGYKADLVFGPDANYYQSFQNGGAGTGGAINQDDFAVKQAYVALRAPVGNGIDIKMGVWDTLVGYEVFEGPNNPNFSRSFGYNLEPTHHTGVLLSYHINDMFSVSGGIANGWSGAINDKNVNGNEFAYLGSLTITLPENTGVFAGSSIYLGVVHGESTSLTGTAIGTDNPDTTSWYAGTTLATGLEGLSIGAAFDYRESGIGFLNAPAGGTFAAESNYAWALAGYASFQATEKLRFNGRVDYTQASDGTFYDGGSAAGSDDKNQLGSLTLTADYSLWANVITRLEGRWDRALGGDRPYPDAKKDAVTLAANFIYKF